MSRTKYFCFAVISMGIALGGSLMLAEGALRLATFRQRRAYPAESNPYFLSRDERRDLWSAGNTGYRYDAQLGWIGKPHISKRRGLPASKRPKRGGSLATRLKFPRNWSVIISRHGTPKMRRLDISSGLRTR